MTTTNEIANKIAAAHSLTKAQGKAIVDAVTKASVAGKETLIAGLGKFKIKQTPERDARNPSTGAIIKVAAATKVAFTPAKSLKDAVNS